MFQEFRTRKTPQILLVLCVFSLQFLQANYHTNKSFLRTRPEIFNLPLINTTFDSLVETRNNRSFRGNFQAIGFYQESFKSTDLARYFLIKNKAVIDISAAVAGVQRSSTDDITAGYLLHAYDTDPQGADEFNAANPQISMKPKQKNYGLVLAYTQGLDTILKNLFFYVNVPVSHIERNIYAKVTSGDAALTDVLPKVFNGSYTLAAGNDDAADYLRAAKFTDKQIATGIADIDAALGYTFLDRKNYQASAAVAITFPTSNKARGEYVFEPIYGNGHHLGLGADLDGWLRLCKYNEHMLKIKAAIKVRYLFENQEKRTLGIQGRDWGQYHLLLAQGANQLIPAANVLTRNVDVTPGAQFDGTLGLGYSWNGFNADLGYNLFAREKTAVRLNDFPANTYAIAARNFRANAGNFALSDANVDGGKVADAIVDITTIDTSVAATPSQVTNSIYGSLGYIIGEDSSTPVLLSLGGKGEWADKNSALSQWQIWGKVGVGF